MTLRRSVCAATAILTFAGLVALPTAGAAAPTGAPPTISGTDLRFTHPSQTLRYGSAAQAGLVSRYVDQIGTDITSYLAPSPTYPEYAGAVALAAHDGVIVAHDTAGYALRYADDTPTELPPDQWIPMRQDTIFDLASMTKLFTSIAAVQLISAGRIGLDTPVAQYIPAFAAAGKGDITIRNLLTHTSGLPADPSPSLCDYATNDQRWAAVYAVTPFAPPNTAYLYSDMNMMTLGKVIEQVTGQPLDRVITQRITAPLGMRDTMFNPPDSLRPRIAAEEYQPWTDRGIVWGTVHDENAYCVGGVSGHAGLFSTAHDLAILSQALLNGGRYGRTTILSQDAVRTLFTDNNQAFPGNAHGLGFELDQRFYMDALSSPVTAGHTGYTGTSIVIDPLSDSFVILLTNRVHPSRNWGSNNPSRRAVARDLALALPVRPAQGPTDWFSGTSDASTATLTVPVAVPAAGAKLTFDLWYDTESTDIGRLEASGDGGTTWQPVPLTLRAGADVWQTGGSFSGFEGRQWLTAAATVPGGTTQLRWRYTTDPLYEGRGVYLDAVRVTGPHGPLFDDGRPKDAALVQLDGWTVGRT
ncbi:serine hydrolase [Rugosimonospora africana]|uniref:Serine hydrolase n=1 Tax=Rugosimonospora africana TaxID=556532 RepID=A0A8J3QXV8_9ACTN|nr:serine hydrolase [Rugosimonospora africana]GIH17843.1 serine hydrolase [Rugosimonospora africana]